MSETSAVPVPEGMARRDWHGSGAHLVTALGQEPFEEVIAALEWQEVPADKDTMTLPFWQGAVFAPILRVFRLPKPAAIAWKTAPFGLYAGVVTGSRIDVYAVQVVMADGTVRHYFAEDDEKVYPIATDFWETPPTPT